MSELDTLERAAADAVTSSDGDGRTLEVRLVTWGEVAQTPQGREAFVRGAFQGVDPGRVMLESGARMVPPDGTHRGAIIVGAATSLEERTDGAYATFRVAPTDAGNELMGLVSGPNPVLRDASVVFRPRPGGSRHRADGVIERTAAELFRVGIVERGAYRSSQIVAVRSAGTEDPGMPEGEIATMPAFDPAPILARMDASDAALAAAEDRIAVAIAAASMAGGGTAHPLAEYESLGAFARAAFEGPSALMSARGEPILARTLADQLTTQNEGMIPPAWLSDVKRIVNLGRRAINAFGGPQALPASGMEIKYPFLTSSNTLIAAQSTQKTEVQSARVDIDDGSATVATYAGGSDIALQLIERSSPSYLDAYERIMLGAWASITDAAFCTALEGASGTTTQVAAGMLGTAMALATSAHADDIFDTTPDHGFVAGDPVMFTSLTGGDATTDALVGRVVWVIPTSLAAKTFRVSLTPGGAAVAWGTADLSAGSVSKVTDTGVKLRGALFQASVSVENATGSPASIVLAGTDLFLAMGAMADIVPPTPAGNPSNADGTALASTLAINVSGLTVVRAPGVSAGKLLVSNPAAAAWHEDGPKWITALDVAKLGRNVAVYSYGAPAIFVPAGVVELTLV